MARKSGTAIALEAIQQAKGVKSGKVSAGDKSAISLGEKALEVGLKHNETWLDWLKANVINSIKSKAQGESFRAGVRERARFQQAQYATHLDGDEANGIPAHPEDTAKVNGMQASLRVLSSRLTTIGLMVGLGHSKQLMQCESYAELCSTAAELRKGSVGVVDASGNAYTTGTGKKRGTKAKSVPAEQFAVMCERIKVCNVQQILKLQGIVAGQIAHIQRSQDAMESGKVANFAEHREPKAKLAKAA